MDKNDSNNKRRSPSITPGKNIEEDGTIIMHHREPHAVQKTHAALIIIEGAEIGKQFFLRRTLYTIGRSEDVDIAIKNDSMISRRHAQIEVIFDHRLKTTNYLLTDLNSTNHIYVNSFQIVQHDLKDGDKIHLGNTTLKFAFLDDIDARFHKEIQHRISYDALTSLFTKESFYLALESEISRCRAHGLPFSLLMIDIDFFKKINDTHGHQAGSFVLSEMGQLIPAHLRDLDLASRYGGEEFTALLVETTSQQALKVSERLRIAIRNHIFVHEGKFIRITISIGIAQYPQDGHTINELIARADKALYQCKHTGRNKVCLYSPDSPQ